MIPHLRKQEASANNLANVGTVGYKKDGVFTQELSKATRRQAAKITDWEQPMVDEVYVDFTQGTFNKTGASLDMAIDGDGFFTLQFEDGSTVLTRSGSFTVDGDGFLAFPGGALVMGEGGPITVGSGQVDVSADGEIQVNGQAVGRIIPQTVEDLTQLEKVGNGSFVVPDGVTTTPVENAQIRQGYVEESNVDIVREMVDMIISYRSYEANAASVQSQDKSLDDLFNRVGGNQ